MRVKGKVYKTTARPEMMYGAEIYPGKNAGEVGRGRNEDAEMDVWCYKDGQNKERIRGTTKVVEIPEKIMEKRLKWNGCVMRRDEE